MRVCFVSREVAGIRGGGIGTYVAEAGKALAAHGHEVWLITEPPDGRAMPELPQFHRVVAAGTGVGERLPFLHGRPWYAYSWLVHRTLQELGVTFDYIEFPDYEAEGLVAFQEQRLFRPYGDTVLGLTLHTPFWECWSYDKQEHRVDLPTRQLCSLEDEAIRIAPQLLSPSEGLRDEVLRRLGLDRDVGIVRYPMELGPAAPPAPRPRGSLAELRCLYFGRIEARKGVEELIEAFRELPELELTLVGEDGLCSPLGRSLREHIGRRATGNVEFRDAMPRDQLLQLIPQYDVCVFPSRFENWPNACIEAMAASRVVLGSKHGGMAEMIEHGRSGFLVDGRDPRDIIRVVREDLAPSLGRLGEIGSNAARRIRELSDPAAYCRSLSEVVRRARAGGSELSDVDAEAHKVSVVVPFYRDRATIDEAIDSACAQSHRNLEILIVNDGSPLPDAEDILARQAAKDPRIRIVSKPNGGLGSARNRGIAEATGEFLLFLDADNVLRRDYARIGVEALARHPESGFVIPWVRLFDDGTDRDRGVFNALPFDRASCLFVNTYGDAGSFFRASLFQEHGTGLRYDEIVTSYEDWALWMDLAAQGVAGERVPRILYDYRVRPDSMLRVEGFTNHRALLGLLVHHHLPHASDDEKALLTTIFQMVGDPMPKYVPLRYKFVDRLSAMSRRVPGFNAALRGILGALQRFGGARKQENR